MSIRRLPTILSILLLAGLLPVLLVRAAPFLQGIENWVADYRVATLTPAQPQQPDIVIAAITEDTLARFPYRSPVDRAFLADLLRVLQAKGARAVLLDVLLDQPTEPEKDQALAAAIREMSIPLVVSHGGAAEGLTEAQVTYIDAFVPADRRGWANLVKDNLDGTVRWIFPGKNRADGQWQAGVVPAMAAHLGLTPPRERIPIAWRGRPDAATAPFRQFPAHAVAVLPAAWFKDKVVLVGADLSDRDRHVTPFRTAFAGNAGVLPGITIHAHALSQVLEGRTAPGQGGALAILAGLIAAGLGLVLGLVEISLWLRALLGLGVVAGIWLLAGPAYAQANILLPQIGPSLSVLLGLWLTDIWRGRRERDQKRFVQAAFAKYLSPALLDDILKDPSKLSIDPKRRDMSYVFTDVAGFTTISEGMDATTLADVMNRYLDGMVKVVFAHGGTVDKFIGDAVFALFGAPRDMEDHAARAASCALELDRFAQGFLAAETAAGRPFGMTRIGVHSGPASVGNFGSDARFEYTALGDAVNTAARLEGLNKYFGTRVAMSGATAERCPDLPRRPIGRIVLKGKTEPIAVYQPLTQEEARSGFMQRYQAAYAAMAAGDAGAAPLLAELAAERPDDGPVAMHRDRLAKGGDSDLVVMSDK
ncbi:adenylate/guanylate cyclase domain-containing protein [Niveispirillum sp.]|uniref:adenylate/guanylate cyclase domain-containing protein n=1 Tax=Niveispirillum sp. TaxID=1917217 RepID=UPI001B793DF5|nr:adenylate/guanylate cyclase domain-containing protein [Niveispirillum sp.]MBP7334486.1 adenylate/guanylate cyclase domain-containing protein [Niveispirillum sp.]